MDGSISARKTFLLGIGCQKGGTTWLHDYLAGHPQVARGFSKEYHVLSAHFFETFRNAQDNRVANTRRLIDGLRRVPGQRRRERIQQLSAVLAQRERLRSMSADLDRYIDYFVELANSDAATRLVCDITPDYACLDAPSLQQVRARLDAAGFDVRVVFIMRDPIERSFSAYRMKLSRAESYTGWLLAPRLGAAQRDVDLWVRLAIGRLRRSLARSQGARPEGSPFLRVALNEVPRHCSSYERTIRAAEAAFPPEMIHYAFFETLFREETIRGLTDFLGLDFRPAAYGSSRNRSAVRSGMSPSEIAALRDAFDTTYSFCAERFGQDLIKRIWPHY